MTTSTADLRGVAAPPIALPRQVREIRPGWWLWFSGRLVDSVTFEVNLTPFWLEVADVEVLPPDPNDRRLRRRRITFADGKYEDLAATAGVYALNGRQARAAGLGRKGVVADGVERAQPVAPAGVGGGHSGDGVPGALQPMRSRRVRPRRG